MYVTTTHEFQTKTESGANYSCGLEVAEKAILDKPMRLSSLL
jgi:hypothetical protein